jgi:2-oxoisovalerate dehydrogenase E2 component (dihydrolipoyl transacylase)
LKIGINSRYDGVVKKLHRAVGEIALIGKPLMDIDTEDDVSSTSSSSSSDEEIEIKKPIQESPPSSPKVEVESQDIYHSNKALATPAVRRISKEYNVDLSQVKASGKGGRVLKEDILQYLESKDKVENKIESVDKVVPITGVKKAMVNTMTKSRDIPSFGYCDEVDMTELIRLRDLVKKKAEEKGVKVTFVPFFVKALSKALEEYPILNSSVDDKCENLTYKSRHNIGVAMDTTSGLIVPNIKDVQSLGIMEVASELNRLMASGKKGVLSPADLSGGTITISNIGIIGGTYTRPLILPPQVAIVALGKIQVVPAFDSTGQVVKKYIMCSSWSADHRVIDGATMARFATLWKHYIENPPLLLLGL